MKAVDAKRTRSRGARAMCGDAGASSPARTLAGARAPRGLRAALAIAVLGSAGADLPALAQADSSEAVSLADVLSVTVRQNPTLAQATFDYEAAEAAVVNAAGIDDWLAAASIMGIYQKTPTEGLVGISCASGEPQISPWGEVVCPEGEPRLAPSDGTPQVSKSLGLMGSLRRSLPDGGQLGLVAETGYSNFVRSLAAPGATGYRSQVRLELVQPLVRGRGRSIARAANRGAEMQRDAIAWDRQAAALAAVRDVIIAYWELAYAQRDREIRVASHALASERLRITRAGIQAGTIAPTEALAVEQVIATRMEEILAAELAVAQSSLDLRRLAGMEIGPAAINLSASAPLAVTPRRANLEALLVRAYDNSPELAALAARQANSQLDVVVTENGLMPRLDLSLTLGPLGQASDLATGVVQDKAIALKVRTQREAFLESLRRMTAGEGLEARLDLSYEQAVQNRAATGSYHQARARLYRARISTRAAQAQIAAALVMAVRQLESAERRIALNQRAIELAEKNVEAEKARFDLGRATNFDIMQRQDELKGFQLRHTRAAVDYVQALAAIDAITGDLLARYGINLAER